MSQLSRLRRTKNIIEFRGESLALRGLSAGFLADAAERNPRFAAIIDKGGNPSATQVILACAKEAPRIIAHSLDAEGDAETEADAADMAIEDQVELIAHILAQTFPTTIGPKMGEFLAMMRGEILSLSASDFIASEPSGENA